MKKIPDSFLPWCSGILGAVLLALILSDIPDKEAPVPVVVEEVVEKTPPTATELCQANTILSGSLQACHRDKACNLNDAEVFHMYLTGKAAVIQCRKAVMIDMFAEVNRQIEQLNEEEEPPKPEVLPLHPLEPEEEDAQRI